MGKFYAVKVGGQSGVFDDWKQVEPLISGQRNAIYRRFPTREEAEAFLMGLNGKASAAVELPPTAYAFVDGSFNAETQTFGYGGVVVGPAPERERIEIRGSSRDERYVGMRNVAGEIGAAWCAILRARERGWKHLTIYHDYLGISAWPDGVWTANTDLTQKYAYFVNRMRRYMVIEFSHVKGHSGVKENEEADLIAKVSAGII